MSKLTPEQLQIIIEQLKDDDHFDLSAQLESHIAALEEENKNAYEKGRLDEAEITLGNLRMILEYEVPNAHENGHIRTCIRDLEDALKGADNQ